MNKNDKEEERLDTFKVTNEKVENLVQTLNGKLASCFDDQPLKLWERNREFAELKLKKEGDVVVTKSFPYTPNAEEEFSKQIAELLEKSGQGLVSVLIHCLHS